MECLDVNVAVVWDATLCVLLKGVGFVNLLFVFCPVAVHVSKMSVPFYQNT